MNASDIISATLLLILVVGLIIYVIVIFEMWKGKKGLFAPYTPVPAPTNAFYPLVSVVPDTPEQAAFKESLAEQIRALGST